MGQGEILGLLFLIQCAVGCFVWTGGGIGLCAGIMSGHSVHERGEDRGWRTRLGIGELGCAMRWVVLQVLSSGLWSLVLLFRGAVVGCEVVVGYGRWLGYGIAEEYLALNSPALTI